MKVAVIKYNAGNIRSVDYALKRLGVEAVITSDKEVLKAADPMAWVGRMNNIRSRAMEIVNGELIYV